LVGDGAQSGEGGQAAARAGADGAGDAVQGGRTLDGAGGGSDGGEPPALIPRSRSPVDRVERPMAHETIQRTELTQTERRLLGDLFAIVEEHADQAAVAVDRRRVEEAFVYACMHHADQRRKSGEEFIIHPVGVA
jgi:GTP pyrophosphokinase